MSESIRATFASLPTVQVASIFGAAWTAFCATHRWGILSFALDSTRRRTVFATVLASYVPTVFRRTATTFLAPKGEVVCKERLGGLLKHYERKAE